MRFHPELPSARLPGCVHQLAAALILLFAAPMCVAVDVGTGAPSDGLAQMFVNAFFRNGFAYLVSLPPAGNVMRFGSTGLIQEFNAAKSSGGTTSGPLLALVKANTSTAPADGNVLQVLTPMYTYYNTVGVNTAGYPTADTLSCPPFTGNSCQYQFFDKNYVLFAYSAANFNGTGFTVRNQFYTKWTTLGGINGLGRCTDVERSLTINGVTTTVQGFAGGEIYNNTSGTLNGRTIAVTEPIYDVYQANGGHGGFLGLPTSDDLVTSGAHHKQTFQGGNIEYDAGGTPQVALPVSTVSLTPASSGAVRMNLGDTLTLTALTLAANGATLTGRVITWSTSNSSVATVTATGNTAVVKAVGGGTALISATSEGVVSPSITVSVSAPCCQLGEGATPAVAQAIQNAVARNRLNIQLPTPNPVRRVGAGYVQQLSTADTPSAAVLVAKSDRVATAYIVTGSLLAAYNNQGGPGGSVGYPSSDPTPGGRQLFENNVALAGNPVRLVSGAILAKWALLNYETGAAGLPAADAASLVSSGATAATTQGFAGGVIYAVSSGPAAGQAFFVSGLILARYAAVGGASGALGLPSSDEYGANGRRQQNFEGGYIDYAPGDAAALDHPAAKRPGVTATPGAVVAGSRVRLAVSGFADQSTLRVSISGQPDFVVTTTNGAYTWDALVPLAAASGTVTITAVDITGGATGGTTVTTSYTVKSLAESHLALVIVQGDGQAAPPGSVLPQTLRVALHDDGGNPVTGAAVQFTASPGAQIVSASTVTDASGQAAAMVRMPLSEGVVLVTASAARLVTTFSARSVASQLSNFPVFTLSSTAALGNGTATIAQKGALLAAAAAIVRFHQNRGDLGGTPVDPATLNQSLKKFCAIDADGNQLCDGFLTSDSGEQLVNLWRVGSAAGATIDVSAESTNPAAIRDLVAQGFPVLLALAVTVDGTPGGGHYVTATGINSDGSLAIADPNPNLARTNLGDYLAGFSAGGHNWKATMPAALRLLPRAPLSTGFLLAAVSQPAAAIQNFAMDIASIAGPCGLAADLTDALVFTPDVLLPAAQVSRVRYCDGAQPIYQVTIGVPQPYRATLTDLAAGGRRADLAGSGVTAYKASRPGVQLVLAPQDVSVSPDGVVNAATFSAGIAPGGLMAIFGSGLAGPGGDTAVSINGVSAPLLAKAPFQVNAQVPTSLEPGTYHMQIISPYGSVDQPVEVRALAPGIFVMGGTQTAPIGAVVNQDGRLNGPLAPGQRGTVLTIYCTGLGATSNDGNLSRTTATVAGVLNGSEIPSAFAGLTPGFIGLYQVNLPVPAATPPGLSQPLALRESGFDSNTVYIAIQ